MEKKGLVLHKDIVTQLGKAEYARASHALLKRTGLRLHFGWILPLKANIAKTGP